MKWIGFLLLCCGWLCFGGVTVAAQTNSRWKPSELSPIAKWPEGKPRYQLLLDTSLWFYRPQHGDYVHKRASAVLAITPHFNQSFFTRDDGLLQHYLRHGKTLSKKAGLKMQSEDEWWRASLFARLYPKRNDEFKVRLLDSLFTQEPGRQLAWAFFDLHSWTQSSRDPQCQESLVVELTGGHFPQYALLTLYYYREDKDKFKNVLLEMGRSMRMEGRPSTDDDYFAYSDSIVVYQHRPLKGWTQYNSFAYEAGEFPRLFLKDQLNNDVVIQRSRVNEDDFAALKFALFSPVVYATAWANPCFYPSQSIVFYRGGKPTFASHFSFGCKRMIRTTKVGDTASRQGEAIRSQQQWKVLRKLWEAYGLVPDVL